MWAATDIRSILIKSWTKISNSMGISSAYRPCHEHHSLVSGLSNEIHGVRTNYFHVITRDGTCILGLAHLHSITKPSLMRSLKINDYCISPLGHGPANPCEGSRQFRIDLWYAIGYLSTAYHRRSHDSLQEGIFRDCHESRDCLRFTCQSLAYLSVSTCLPKTTRLSEADELNLEPTTPQRVGQDESLVYLPPKSPCPSSRVSILE
jgi:hypothetical protein